jgi:thiamine-monophosphate kinase
MRPGKDLTVSDVGEFGLIARLAAALGPPEDPSVLVGIGDDAAAWMPSPGTLTVATTDSLVEGVHFDLRTTSWTDLGWKALAENVSDVAAMGCRPRYALVALGLPGGHRAADVEELYGGLRECAQAFGCAVVGGDVVRAPCVVLQVTLLGESLSVSSSTDGRPLLERSGARPGDVVAVTGPLGGSAAGLRLLTAERQPTNLRGPAEALLRAHRRPTPRVAAGIALVEAGVRCAIDVSDGLVADVGHICERSGVDAEIWVDQVPVHPDARAVFGEEALTMALAGGEDYELVCAGPLDIVARASDMLVERGEGAPIVLGSIRDRSGPEPRVSVIDRTGNPIVIPRGGYQHFGAPA